MGSITIIQSGGISFNNIQQAIKYLDNKYTREGWIDDRTSEFIYINGISVWVQYGLRVDPDDTQFAKFRQWCVRYPELNIRLS